MGAKGDVKQSKALDGFKAYAGLALVEEIVAINPTKEEKAKMYNYELTDESEDIKYTGKNDAGDDKLNFDIYYRINVKDSTPRKHRIFLENTPAIVEGKDGNPDLYVFVNQVGQLVKVPSEDELPDWFKYFQKWNDDEKRYESTDDKKTFRKCLKGEDMLVRFLREALALDYDKPSAELNYNYKKLFTGNVQEFYADLTSELFRPFVVMLQVATSKEGTEHYEKLWIPNNNFGVPTLSKDSVKFINNNCQFPKGYMTTRWNKYKETHKNYPPSGYAPLAPVSEYDAANDVAASQTAKQPASETGDDY